MTPTDDTPKLICIACGTELANIMEGEGVQPDDGLAFVTTGHYGTTVFDPMDETKLIAVVCDACLRKARLAGRLIHYTPPSNPSRGQYRVYSDE